MDKADALEIGEDGTRTWEVGEEAGRRVDVAWPRRATGGWGLGNAAH